MSDVNLALPTVPATPVTTPGLAEAVVDLTAIATNVHTFRRQLSSGTDVLAVVKADAFGHGAVPVARAALAAGASWLGVARAGEAVELRAGGVTAPILVWLYHPAELMQLAGLDVDVNVATVAELRDVATTPGVRNVHLKLDTGLHRGGCAPEHWIELVRAAAHFEALGAVMVRGLWSHLSHGDQPGSAHSRRQLMRFRAGVALARSAGLTPEHLHLTNSAGAVTVDAPECTLTRIGAGLYGIDELGIGLRPALRLTAGIAQVRRIRVGEGVSYRHDFVASSDTTIGLVPVGYADGIPRIAGSSATVLCRGRRMPVIGRIAMDQFVVDAGAEPIEPGDPVTVFGPGDDGEPTAADWANWAGTIPHEIYCGLGRRIPRRYVESAR